VTHGTCQLWDVSGKKNSFIVHGRRWTSENGIASRLRDRQLRNRGLIPGRRQATYRTSKASRGALGSICPPTQWVPNDFSPRVKRPGHEADRSLPSSAEVKNDHHSPIYLHGEYNTRFTFTFPPCIVCLCVWLLPAIKIINKNKIRSIIQIEIGNV
jgi:hypothetical protein